MIEQIMRQFIYRYYYYYTESEVGSIVVSNLQHEMLSKIL